MNDFYKILSLYLILSGVCFYGYGQTYIYNPSKPGCNQTWGNDNCWDKTQFNDPVGCTSNPSLFPPLTPSGCKVNVVINHDLTFTGNLTFGGTYNRISVGNGAKFNVTGNVTIAASREVEFNVSGSSEFNVDGELIISSGSQSVDTNLNITGDGTSEVVVGSIKLNQRANINILEDGGLISNGETDYAGNNSEINVYGFFRTESVQVSGGQGKQLNVFGNGNVVVDGDVRIDGTAQITFGGDSSVYIEGDVIINGSGDRLIIKDNAKVVVCGENSPTDPPPATVNKGGLNECLDPNDCPSGGFYVSCRLLPVELIFFDSEFSFQENSIKISWSTGKEWENSHFEIERSEQNIKNFKRIGQVKGMGWTDSVSEYAFEDKNLPLSGGMVYYRLKQVDFNGKFEYSSVVAVNLQKLQFTQGVWRAYPNPTNGDQLRIGLLDRNEYNGESLTFRIIQTTAVSESISVSDEVEMNDILTTMIPKINRGLFVVEIRWGQKMEHIKVLKP